MMASEKKDTETMAKKPTTQADEGLPMLTLIETPDVAAPTVLDQALVVLTHPEQADQFYTRMKAETDRHVADVTTAKGRDEVRSLARRVTTTATSLDKSALQLTADMRAQVKAINDARMPMVERIKALAAEVRKPLTDWEDAEKARVEANDAVIAGIRGYAAICDDDTSVTVADRGKVVWAMTFEAPQWTAEEAARATEAKDAAVAALVAARNRLAKEEADAAELEALRAEKARRDEADRIEREAREIVEAKARYARDIIQHIRQCGLGMIDGKTYPYIILLRELNEKIEIGERAAESFGGLADEVERVRVDTIAALTEAQEAQARRDLEQAANQAREDAKREADRLAQVERDRVQAEHEAALQAERDRAAAIEAAAEAERQEARRIEQARLAAEAIAQSERDSIAAADAKRAKDRAHISAVMREAKEAIITCGVTEDQARAIVTAIKGDLIPNVRIAF